MKKKIEIHFFVIKMITFLKRAYFFVKNGYFCINFNNLKSIFSAYFKVFYYINTCYFEFF